MRRVVRLEVTESTNDDAKRLAREGAPHGTVVVAEEQTRGRGRQGRTWTSTRGESLLVSMILRPRLDPGRLPPLALVAGLAVCEAIAPWTRTPPGIKWPNDVLLGERKVAGVLLEAQLLGAHIESLVVGFGVNVHQREFPADLAGTATSLACECDEPERLDRSSLLAALVEGVDREITAAAARGLGDVLPRLAALDVLRGRRVSSGVESGVASGIDEQGRLIVHADDGTSLRWSAGEVHLVRGPAYLAPPPAT